MTHSKSINHSYARWHREQLIRIYQEADVTHSRVRRISAYDALASTLGYFRCTPASDSRESSASPKPKLARGSRLRSIHNVLLLFAQQTAS